MATSESHTVSPKETAISSEGKGSHELILVEW